MLLKIHIQCSQKNVIFIFAVERLIGDDLVLSISLDTFYSNKNYAARKI